MGNGGDLPEVKGSGREADHSSPSSAEVKNSGTIPSLPPDVFMAQRLISYAHGKLCLFTFIGKSY
jgi:hypothetical protein